MQAIVELPEFQKRASSLLNEDERISIINYLAAHPQSGDLMQGTGGIRKLRWSAQGRGKSGGVRPNAMTLPNSQVYFCKIMVVQMASAFSSIKQGLQEAIDYSGGKVKNAIVHEFSPLDVKQVRAQVGMSQSEFASAFGISVSTLRHWERGDRKPQGPALVLLNVVSKEPETVLRALAS